MSAILEGLGWIALGLAGGGGGGSGVGGLGVRVSGGALGLNGVDLGWAGDGLEVVCLHDCLLAGLPEHTETTPRHTSAHLQTPDPPSDLVQST